MLDWAAVSSLMVDGCRCQNSTLVIQVKYARHTQVSGCWASAQTKKPNSMLAMFDEDFEVQFKNPKFDCVWFELGIDKWLRFAAKIAMDGCMGIS